MKSPYPYFGGKSRIAAAVWKRIGDVPNYVEPFLGSAAFLLARPNDHLRKLETVNDKDGYIVNFWRAVSADPDEVARYADHPVFENDLHARHLWLVQHLDALPARLESDPDFYDAKIAGWWVWGMSCWIGSEFCSGVGPHKLVDGQVVNGDSRSGIHRKHPHLLSKKGIQRRLPHLGDAGMGIKRQLPHLGDAGMGIKRRLPHLGDAGKGVNRIPLIDNRLRAYFAELQERLRRVRVTCGDWQRVTGPSITFVHGLTGVILDPPYTMDNRDQIYTHDSGTIANEARAWALANGDNPQLRIAYCGYDDGYEWPRSWSVLNWKATNGYGASGKGNAERERVWFSPHCLKLEQQLSMFAFGDDT
jgi:hypothetical protein